MPDDDYQMDRVFLTTNNSTKRSPDTAFNTISMKTSRTAKYHLKTDTSPNGFEPIMSHSPGHK